MVNPKSRTFGAVLGSCGGLSAGYGSVWSGLGDAGVHVWVIAIVVSTLLGAFSWGPLQNPDDTKSPHWFYAALFGGTVGLIAGAFASYPFGALFGAPGGAVGAAVSCVILNRLPEAFVKKGVPVAAVVGSTVGLLFVMGVSP